jgi:hypothetical protein
MPSVLRALPYFDDMTEIVGPGVREQILPRQIVLWVSVTPVEQFELPPNAPRFPAILDTGLNDVFAIAPVHLRAWAGFHWSTLPEEDVELFYGDIPVPVRRATLWLHRNQYGWRDSIDPLRPPLEIELSDGITVYGNGEQVGKDSRTKTLRAPRLPLIGLRAFTDMGCQLHIDCLRRLVSQDIPD